MNRMDDKAKSRCEIKYTSNYESPVGSLTVTANERRITGIFYGRSENGVGSNELTVEAVGQLAEYFAGRLKKFALPIETAGTPFQNKVWSALQTVLYGETRSYRQIAEGINCPGGSRAVGAANHKNPVAIAVPCHRIIGADGKLVGYAGGLAVKEYLLTLEKRYYI